MYTTSAQDESSQAEPQSPAAGAEPASPPGGDKQCRQGGAMDALVRLALLAALCAALLVRAQGQDQDIPSDQSANTGDLDQEQLCKIFNGPGCATEAPVPGLYNQCDCPDKSGDHCECVFFFQCDNSTGAYNVDGVGLLDVRKKDGCPTVELKCCKIDIPKDKREKPEPHKDFPLPPPPADPSVCGVRHEGGLASSIVNNNDGEAGFGEFPWMAALFVTRRPGAEPQYKCGGAIINDVVVLTAVHCIKGIAEEKLKVRAGEWDRETESEIYKHQDRGVRTILRHPDYYGGNNQYDVALLILDSPLVLGKHIGTVCLPEPGDGSGFDGQRCIVAGWGKEKLDDRWPHRYLKRLELPVVARDQCEAALRNTGLGDNYILHESFLCAGGEEGIDACQGDGGSPLVCPNESGHYQVAGVVSWGVDCGLAGVPGLYTNVPVVRAWIDEALSDNGLGPRRKTPPA
ncbi:Phenoloxidase-activating factor 2 [Frankliniella fusca]|uniref:Phenoloxidase-activating factor 2 n=1 Tax=Frankliniella fusca TaxID=407009 RepID=A0AAE1HJJ6_9NEOP|nr:Phenoloxidase-activating factor 2 [Frankliniella fusca]